jgi:hypothetical protein
MAKKWRVFLLVLSLCLMIAGIASYVQRVVTYNMDLHRVSQMELAKLFRELNLDRPLVVQYIGFLGLFLPGLLVFTWYWLTLPAQIEVKRGCWLSGFLLAMITANPLFSVYYLLLYPPPLTRIYIHVWVLLALSILGFVNYVCALALWQWKKVGLYGFGISTLLIAAINVTNGLPLWATIFGFAGIVILVFLLRPFWRQMA